MFLFLVQSNDSYRTCTTDVTNITCYGLLKIEIFLSHTNTQNSLYQVNNIFEDWRLKLLEDCDGFQMHNKTKSRNKSRSKT